MGILESLEVKGKKQLDLNGHTLRMYSAKTAMSDMFMINHGSLTVLDSSSDQNGTILGSTYNDSCYLINVHTYGQFTLNSGTLKVDAGSLRNDTRWKRVIYCYAGGTVTINGGEFHKKFWMRPKFPDGNGKNLIGYHVAAKLNGGTFHETLSVDKNYTDYGSAYDFLQSPHSRDRIYYGKRIEKQTNSKTL